MTFPVVEACGYTYIGRDGEIHARSEEFLEEHFLDLYVEDALLMQIVCLPENLEELVLGRLLTEGVIARAADVKELRMGEDGREVRVTLAPTAPRFSARPAMVPVTPIQWKPEWIFALADRFAEGMPLHELTWATHSCLLAREGELLFACEDIGRHNALDKVIGYGLRQGIDLTKCIVYSSGRIPTEMAQKAIRAGIPVLSSKAAPTVQAAAMAKAYNLTLICAARRDRLKLMNGSLEPEK